MNRAILWTMAAAAAILVILETGFLLLPGRSPAAPTVDLRVSIQTLQQRAEELELAYDRLETEFRRYIQRAPSPSRQLGTETILTELDRLGDEIGAIKRAIVRNPDEALAIPSMALDIEKLDHRMDEILENWKRREGISGRRYRRLLGLLIANSLLTLAILARAGRRSGPDPALKESGQGTG